MLARCDVKAALVDAVTGAVAMVDDTAAVRWAPQRDPETADYVVFGPMKQSSNDVPTVRQRPVALDDEWTMDVVCVAWTRGEYEPEVTDRRCEALMAAVVGVVAANPSVDADGACVLGITVPSVDGPQFGADDTGGVSVGVVTVRVKQRIG